MTSEKGLSYEKYIHQIRTECKRVSNWPVVSEKFSEVEYSGYCPFDMTPGYIAEYLDEYPAWAVSFEEKNFKSTNDNCFCIELPLAQYKDLEPFTNVTSEHFEEWDLDIKLGDFLGEPGDKLLLEREFLELGEGWPKILIERLVAVASDGQIAVWGLSIVRELVNFEETEGIEQVLHTFGVERYTDGELGIEQNWYREWVFKEKITIELLRYPRPLVPSFDGTFVGPLTMRNAQHC